MTSYRTEDYYNYRLQRAKETIQEVEVHIPNYLKKDTKAIILIFLI